MHNVGVALALAPALAAVCLADNLDKYGVFTPKKIALGSTPSMNGQTYSGGFTLTSDEPLATLDYDYEVAGLPYFVVSSISNGTVDVEIKYSEQFPALSLNYSDGPSQFTTSIASSLRVGTHRFTESDSDRFVRSAPMTDESVVVPEFGGQSNPYGACLDGAKRDRYIRLGNFYHTTRIMGVTNSKPEQITGTWEFLFEYQADYGQLPGFVPISYQSPIPTPEIFLYNACTSGASYYFPDYVILGLIGLESYMDYHDGVAFVEAHWEEFTRAMTWLVGCQGSNGFTDLTPYAVVFLGAGAESANAWVDTAARVKTAINDLLWNDTLGNYVLDVSTPEVYGVSAIAFALTSGVANETQIKLCVEGLEGLRQGPGYLDSSTTGNTTEISPNTNGFLLDALLQHGYTDQAVFLLDNLWDAMISNESYRTGASWEYVAQSLEPGIDFFTSLSHPWGGAPTYALTNYIVGIRPVEFGFRRWIVNPLVTGLNVTSASATVSTPHGDLSAAWELVDSQLSVTITAPVGTDGTFEVAQPSSPSGVYEEHLVGTGEATSFTVQL
ncbi:Glycoside hydrolase [Phytophthora cinnamomi]|uniref:Glycoside hydrolase n=1 Tax=Phytophthora cinnamomi TaxID=4785 RepID=UPI00355ABE0C|nr:Glycoside hydrolase [Phytophthora cinnamomi]